MSTITGFVVQRPLRRVGGMPAAAVSVDDNWTTGVSAVSPQDYAEAVARLCVDTEIDGNLPPRLDFYDFIRTDGGPPVSDVANVPSFTAFVGAGSTAYIDTEGAASLSVPATEALLSLGVAALTELRHYSGEHG